MPKRQSFTELRELQRRTFATIRRPLAAGARMQRTWTDGRPTKAVVAEFIKPNDRLTSLERIEIYNKQYWFRLLDCLYDDYPGLRAILGERKFERLRIAYLDRYPSQSFSLRNLGSRMEQFLREEPHLIQPQEAMALDMARFEWAQVEAFDGPEQPALVPDDLLGRDPAVLRLALQPHLTLLEMEYPLDDFVIAVKKKGAMRSEASNAAETDRRETRHRPVRLPRAQRVFLAVYRYENGIYYKRMTAEAFLLLGALREGATVAEACAAALASVEGDEAEWAENLKQWFATWTELGWLCKRPKER